MPDTRTGNQSLTIEIDGRGVERLDTEAGGHRVQRIPRSERKGRVHSSTVTVAVLAGSDRVGKDNPWLQRSDKDFVVEWRSGNVGAGGQNHQKTQNCARLTHVPTGTVRGAQTRSRMNSLKSAMEAMTVELDRQAGLALGTAVNGDRRSQVGSGERSDKRRTYRFQEGRVHDHASGRSASTEKVMAGCFGLLWN